MKYPVLILQMFLMTILGCRKTDDFEVSACIQSQIETFSKNSCETGANVRQYLFQGQVVYTFSMGRCGGDLSTTVRDNSCNTLGELGGFDGNTKIQGEEFSKAELKKTIWEK